MKASQLAGEAGRTFESVYSATPDSEAASERRGNNFPTSKSPTFLALTNTEPFAAWIVVTGDATPGGIRVVRSFLGAISSLPIKRGGPSKQSTLQPPIPKLLPSGEVTSLCLDPMVGEGSVSYVRGAPADLLPGVWCPLPSEEVTTLKLFRTFA